MYSFRQLDTPPPPSQFRRPWSPDPYDPLPTTSSQMLPPHAHNQRREPSDVSVEALDLADYARTLATRTAEHNDTSYQPYSIPAYRSYDQYDQYPPSPPAGGFRSFALASHDTLSPPSLSAGSTSRTPTGASSRGPPRHRPFSLPPSSYPQHPTDLHSQTSRGHTNPSLPGAPQSEIDITQFPSFTRGWYANQPKSSKNHTKDPFTPSQPNVFDPSFPADTYRSEAYDVPRLGYYSPPPSYPSHASGSSRDYLPWSNDPPDTHGPLDAEVKEERMRMLEREFGAKGKEKDAEEGEHVVGSVDSNGKLITQGPKKRLATRWLQVLLALLAAISSIYAGLAIKPNPPAPPAGKPPLYILYALSVISFLVSTYMFLIKPCCGGRRAKKNTPFTQGPGGMMVLPVQGLPGGKKKGGKKKGGPPGGDVQVNLIVDPGMFGQSRRDEDEEEDEDDEVGSVPGTYTTSSSKKRKRGPKRRSVFDGLALEAQWKEARKWLKWGMLVDVLSLVLWGGMFVLILLGKRCPPGQFDGWCDAYNLSTAAACLIAFAFAFSIFFDVKDLHTSQASPRTRT